MRIIAPLALLLLGNFPHLVSAQPAYDPRGLRADLTSADWNTRRVALIRLASMLKLDERKTDFLPLFDDGHYQVRETAIELMYGSRDSTLIEPLLARCKDEHASVREAAVGDLDAFSQPRVAAAVAKRIADSDASVRRRAIAYFHDHDSAAAQAALVQALADGDALNRLHAVQALSEHRTAGAVDEFTRLIAHDPDPRVRREAAQAFLVIDSRAGLVAVARALASEPDPSVRSSFVFTLKSRTRQDYGEDSKAWLGWLSETSR